MISILVEIASVFVLMPDAFVEIASEFASILTIAAARAAVFDAILSSRPLTLIASYSIISECLV